MSKDLVQNFAMGALGRAQELQAQDPDIAGTISLLAGQLAAGEVDIDGDAIEALREHNKSIGFKISDDLFDRAKGELLEFITPAQG